MLSGALGFAAACVAALLLRLVYLSLYKRWFAQGPSGDAAYHLAAVRQIRSGASPFGGVPEFLLSDEPDAYPILFHRFSALFSDVTIQRSPYLPNLIIWTLSVGLFTVYAGYAGQLYGLNPISVGASFLVFFLALASNVSSDMNGLNYMSLSERLLARIFSASFFVCLAVGMDRHDMISLGLAVFLGSAGCITSLFGRQSLAFTSPLVAILTLSPVPLYVLAGSFAVATVVDRGYFLRGLRQQIRYSIAYNKFTKHSPYYQGGLSRFVSLANLMKRQIGISARILEVELHEPTRILFRYPEIIALGALLIWNGRAVFGATEAIVVASLFLYVLTTFKALRHLGEANRYLEYNLWLVVPFALGREWSEGNAPLILWFGYFGLVAFATAWKFRSWRPVAASFPTRDVLGEFLNAANIKTDDVVLPVPVPLGAAVSVRSRCKAIMYQGVAVSVDLYSKYLQQPPYLNRDWNPIAKTFGATVIVADRSMVDAAQSLMGWTYDFSSLPIRAECERYIAYDLTNGKSAANA